jgi:hypothetical protein
VARRHRSPTHLIFCNEQGVTDPGVQRLDLATGEVDTIVTGTDACDPLHVTPWGWIVFGEEAGGGSAGGRVYELVDPLHTTNVLLDRTTGVFTDGAGGEGAENVVARPAIGRLSFEGVGLLPNGVVYYGDENRPNVGNAGGSYFTFIPGTLRNPNTPTRSPASTSRRSSVARSTAFAWASAAATPTTAGAPRRAWASGSRSRTHPTPTCAPWRPPRSSRRTTGRRTSRSTVQSSTPAR